MQNPEWDWTKSTSSQGATASLRLAFTSVVATDTETAGPVAL